MSSYHLKYMMIATRKKSCLSLKKTLSDNHTWEYYFHFFTCDFYLRFNSTVTKWNYVVETINKFPIIQKHTEDGAKVDISCCSQSVRKQLAASDGETMLAGAATLPSSLYLTPRFNLIIPACQGKKNSLESLALFLSSLRSFPLLLTVYKREGGGNFRDRLHIKRFPWLS